MYRHQTYIDPLLTYFDPPSNIRILDYRTDACFDTPSKLYRANTDMLGLFSKNRDTTMKEPIQKCTFQPQLVTKSFAHRK